MVFLVGLQNGDRGQMAELKPEPTPQPMPEQTPQPTPEPTPQPPPQPTPERTPQPTPEQTPDPTLQPTPGPSVSEPLPPPILRQSTVVVVVDNEGKPQAQRCRWSFVALIGPFEEGQSSEFEAARRCPSMGGTRNTITDLKIVADYLKDYALERVVLVGRTDTIPIDNENYRSNLGLGQARADWVAGELREGLMGSIVLSIPGGPTSNNERNACDRVVEVQMCSSEEVRAAPTADDPRVPPA